LKKNHPDAARLYEKHAGGNNIVIGGGAIQLQVRARAVPAPGLPPNLAPVVPLDVLPQFPNQLPGPRTIRSENDGQKVEITDEDGKKIRVKVTKIIDGKEVSQESSADDLKTLSAEHPDAAKLYTQLTGKSVE
jgi:hypothetical protein